MIYTSYWFTLNFIIKFFEILFFVPDQMFAYHQY
jgi:hypothetical protein